LQEVSRFRVHFGSQVVHPAHRRWNLRPAQLHPVRRKPLRGQFIRQGCRCGAQELLAEMWNSFSLVDEVASLLITMQSLPMPWQPSANATGLFVWPGEGVH